MLTKTLVLTGILSLSLGGLAMAEPHPQVSKPASHAVANDEVLTGHGDAVRKLLAETRAARDAIARGETRVATDLVNDALALDRSLGARHQYVLLESAQGTFEQISQDKGTPVATTYDRFADRERLDLHETADDLARAQGLLTAGKLADADHALGRVDRAISLQEQLKPELAKLAAANLELAVQELEAGRWQSAKTEMQAVMKDVDQQIAIAAHQTRSARQAKAETRHGH